MRRGALELVAGLIAGGASLSTGVEKISSDFSSIGSGHQQPMTFAGKCHWRYFTYRWLTLCRAPRDSTAGLIF